MNVKEMLKRVDQVFDELLGQLGCEDGRDADLISHWQDGANPGFRIQVTRHTDKRMLTRFVDQLGKVSA